MPPVPGAKTLRYPDGVGTLEIQEQVALAPLTTIGVGGAARFFAHIRTEQELEEAVTFHEQNHLPLAILGGGSNLLVPDEGFPGLVLHLDLKGELRFEGEGHVRECVAPSGSSWDDLVREACHLGLSGVECLAGIPGYVGGTPVQNVGAYGQEVSQTITRVRAYDLQTRSYTEIAAENCQFSYRSSRFNHDEGRRFLVTAVTFRLQRSPSITLTYPELQTRFAGSTPTPIEVYQAVRDIRHKKGMLVSVDDPDSRSAGSFFKNPIVTEDFLANLNGSGKRTSEIPHWVISDGSVGPPRVKLPAAWLVEAAGFAKGFTQGRVGISTKHSLALVNRGNATFEEIVILRDEIRRAVAENFGISLEQEPVQLGPIQLTARAPGRH